MRLIYYTDLDKLIQSVVKVRNYFEDISGTNAKKLVSDNRDDEDIYTLLGFINDGDSNDFYFEEIDNTAKEQNVNDDIDTMNFW